ncbi:hypothetical protein [Actinomadura macrotermitis]|uniref:DUF1440 domain-containing protein n=1 Tax=Actinomadura macrotermitis TaxID=2585200 RepID=A0A7K0BZ95_9ACTN|nr:hypothetical protein [Actinomadura macrotermitis]MQY06501.1 hypothetical protein [Actinomadura macrotermitis]
MWKTIWRGAIAGAAGTTALDITTYADMAWRGRPASETPSETVDRLGRLAGHPVPGTGEQRDNRLSGLGALTGLGTGVAIGVAAAAVRAAGARPPFWLGAALVTVGTMAATALPMTALKITDPRGWSAADWLSDAVPHLAYGLVVHGALTTLDP